MAGLKRPFSDLVAGEIGCVVPTVPAAAASFVHSTPISSGQGAVYER